MKPTIIWPKQFRSLICVPISKIHIAVEQLFRMLRVRCVFKFSFLQKSCGIIFENFLIRMFWSRVSCEVPLVLKRSVLKLTFSNNRITAKLVGFALNYINNIRIAQYFDSSHYNCAFSSTKPKRNYLEATITFEQRGALNRRLRLIHNDI